MLTAQIDRERAKALKRRLGGVWRKIDAAAIRAYQDARKAEGVSSGQPSAEYIGQKRWFKPRSVHPSTLLEK